MSMVNPSTQTAYASTDWDAYLQSRPPYPTSLTDLICDYRRAHSDGPWERVVDIGGGIGIAATNFAAAFETIHLSDPSPQNIDKAKAFLPDWLQHHGCMTQLEFSQALGESAWGRTGEGVADLVICATAAHFIDPDGLAASAAKMLRSGGTFAIFSYWLPFLPDQSQEFNLLFTRTVCNMILASLQSNLELAQPNMMHLIARVSCGNGGLDSLPIPARFYRDPTRIRINCGRGEMEYGGAFIEQFEGKFEPLPTRVTAEENIRNYYTGTDSEATGWSFSVDKEWLYSFIDSLRSPEAAYGAEEKEICAEFDRAWAANCPTGKVRTVWPCNLVLGTRK